MDTNGIRMRMKKDHSGLRRPPLVAVLAVALLVTVESGTGQVLPPRPTGQKELRVRVFGLGFSAGFASGIGLSFRHHLPGKLVYQVVGGIIKSKDELKYSIGGELQFDLQRTAGSRFFIVGAAGYYYAGSNDTNGMEAPGRIGLGIGGEIPLSDDLGLTGELLFTYLSDGTVLPLPQASVHYYFN